MQGPSISRCAILDRMLFAVVEVYCEYRNSPKAESSKRARWLVRFSLIEQATEQDSAPIFCSTLSTVLDQTIRKGDLVMRQLHDGHFLLG